MAQPTPYDRQFSFQDFQAQEPTTPLPGDEVDGELNAVKLTLDQTLVNLAKIQRDDGALKNGSVGQDQLSPSLSIGFTYRGVWAVGQNYVLSDGVSVGSLFYRAKAANFSSVGNAPGTDPATWELIADITPLGIAINSVYTAALQNGVLSADAAGRAKMAAGYIVASLLADGALSADTTGLAKMADGYLAATAGGRAKMADGFLSADATGRAKMDDGFVTLDEMAAAAKAFSTPVNLGLSAAVGSSALTISLTDAAGAAPSASSPVLIPFRSATAASGVKAVRQVTAATTLVISSGSTAGFTSATAGRIWVVAFDDAGTVRLGAVNCRNGTTITPLSPSGIASSTAEGGAGAADSAGVIYTGTAVTAKAYTILGFMEWSAGLTTAGTWAIVPTKIEVYSTGMATPGDRVQRVRTTYATYSSTATTGAFADNKMQNTEGAEYIAATIVPTSAANVLAVSARAHIAPGSGSSVQVGLFQDSTAAALSQTADFQGTADALRAQNVDCDLVAGTVSSTTFKIRVAASSGTTYINGASAGRRGGGALISHLQVEELQA